MNREKLQRLKAFIEKINASNSRNYKLEILNELDLNDPLDEFVLYALEFVFNPFKITGISDKKMKRVIEPERTVHLNTIEQLLEWILENKTGSDKVLANIKDYIHTFAGENIELQQLLESIIIKDFNIGVSTTSINKLYPDLIPSFNVMLAEKYRDNKAYIDGRLVTITLKLDGNRCLLFNYPNDPVFLSRQGKIYEGLTELAEEIHVLPTGYVYDGELIADTDYTLSSEERYRLTTGTLHKKGDKKKDLIFHIFDMIPIADFEKQHSVIDYVDRRAMLNKLEETRHIKILPVIYSGIANTEVIEQIATDLTTKGEEGIMINLEVAPYQFKRTKDLLKVKLFNTADVKVVGYYEGTGNFVGTLGGVNVQFIAPDGTLHTANCGSGFSLEQRKEIWLNPDVLIDTIIEINYFEISQNKEGAYSLRFPTFKHFRPDKTEISMY